MSIKAENRLHFGVPIFEASLPVLEERRDELIELLLNMREQDKTGIQRSNQRGWHSDDDLHKSEEPVLKWLTEHVYQLGSHLIKHAEGMPVDSEIFMSSLWANINDFGAWNTPHFHVSGVVLSILMLLRMYQNLIVAFALEILCLLIQCQWGLLIEKIQPLVIRLKMECCFCSQDI